LEITHSLPYRREERAKLKHRQTKMHRNGCGGLDKKIAGIRNKGRFEEVGNHEKVTLRVVEAESRQRGKGGGSGWSLSGRNQGEPEGEKGDRQLGDERPARPLYWRMGKRPSKLPVCDDSLYGGERECKVRKKSGAMVYDGMKEYLYR